MRVASERPLRLRLRREGSDRDTATTAFTNLLSDLIARVPGAHAAALVDRDGEAVDYAGSLSPFDVKVAAAHWQIVLGELDQVALCRSARQLVVRGRLKSFVIRALADGYTVVLVLGARAGFAACSRAFLVFERAVLEEAGIGVDRPGPRWSPVAVECDARSRPRTLVNVEKPSRRPLEVLGAVMGLGPGEVGFRVRLETGFEATVVREPGGSWYADEAIE